MFALATGSILLSPIVFPPPFCPATAVLRGYYGGVVGLTFGPVGALLGVVVLGLGIFLPWAMGMHRPHQGSIVGSPWMAVVMARWIGGVLLGLSVAGALDASLSYFCADRQAIVVHTGPLQRTITYPWSDVARVEVGCTRSKSGPHAYFKLYMKDDRMLALQSWEAHRADIDAALSPVAYAYDTAGVERCPPEYRSLFPRR